MPRARINAPEDDVVIAKPRTRKPRVIDSDVLATPAPRKRAPARPRVAEANRVEEPARKAPTPIAARRRRHSQKSKSILVVLGICVVISGIGIGIGVMDAGSINVVAVVNERNEKINKGEVRDESGNTITQTLQVQNGDSTPNGGLPMGDPVPTPPPPPAEIATTTASTTDSSASSTEPVPAAKAEAQTEEPI